MDTELGKWRDELRVSMIALSGDRAPECELYLTLNDFPCKHDPRVERGRVASRKGGWRESLRAPCQRGCENTGMTAGAPDNVRTLEVRLCAL